MCGPGFAVVARGENYWSFPLPLDEEQGRIGLAFGLGVQEPRGSLRIVSADPAQAPLIDHHYREVIGSALFDRAWQDFTDLCHRVSPGRQLRNRPRRGRAASGPRRRRPARGRRERVSRQRHEQAEPDLPDGRRACCGVRVGCARARERAWGRRERHGLTCSVGRVLRLDQARSHGTVACSTAPCSASVRRCVIR